MGTGTTKWLSLSETYTYDVTMLFPVYPLHSLSVYPVLAKLVISVIPIWPTATPYLFFSPYNQQLPVPVAARSKAWVCGPSLAGIVGSNPAGAWMFVVSVVCCQVEVSASGWSLVQRSFTDCGVSEYDHESSIMRSWTTGDCCAMVKNNQQSMTLREREHMRWEWH